MNELLGFAAKIGLAALLGGAVGAERERTGKWAGLRTHMLIAVGAALLTDVSVHIGAEFNFGSQAWDPGRIAAQIVSGIGFLGAGTIIQARGTVHGLTTAAGLWVSAAIGLAVGAQFYVEAAATTVTLLVILAALRPVERMLRSDRRQVVLELGDRLRLEELEELLDEVDLEIDQLQISGGAEGRTAMVRFRGSPKERQRLIVVAARRGISTADGD